MKKCTKCKIPKELSEFHKAKQNKDGHKNCCRSCYIICNKDYKSQPKNKAVAAVLAKAYRSQPNYKEDQKERHTKWSHSDKGKDSCSKSRAKYSSSKKGNSTRVKYLNKYPNAHKSRCYFNNKTRTDSLPKSCEGCNDTLLKIQAHHHDYNLPMNVTYLCKSCHVDWHQNNTPLNRVEGIFTETIKMRLGK